MSLCNKQYCCLENLKNNEKFCVIFNSILLKIDENLSIELENGKLLTTFNNMYILNGVEAVSYTHLDVYKRQVEGKG